MRTLDAAGSRRLDESVTREMGLSSAVLMEIAAIAVTGVVDERFPSASRVALVCGPGNNGGDGLSMARHLAARGRDARVFLTSPGEKYRGLAGTQLASARAAGIPVSDLSEADGKGWAELVACDLVVDAILGTGLSRPVEGPLAELLGSLGDLGRPILAVDLPTGLSADSGTHPARTWMRL